MVTHGIWRAIELASFNARIEDVLIKQDHSTRGRVRLSVRVKAQSDAPTDLVGSVSVSRQGAIVAEALAPLSGNCGEAELTVTKPELWWPNGMGDQPLYDVVVDLIDKSGAQRDRDTKRIGLRTLRLEEKKDKIGESFRFVCNGVPFFGKGSNTVPFDVFVSRMTPERYERIVSDAAEANTNMLRVWGGGVYEDEAFYDACDRYGVCVWQDFMFACSCVPTDETYLQNVRAEAEDNIRRLRHRASLALWCGNNEIEHGFIAPEKSLAKMGWEDYSKVFRELLPRAVRDMESDTDCISGSGHTPPPNQFDPFNLEIGDVHLWKLRGTREPWDQHYQTRQPRFCSEFGFQSIPGPKTYRQHISPEDESLNSHTMELHPKAEEKSLILIDYLYEWFRQPVGFENTAWLSQIAHGLSIKIGTEHWRRSMPRTMGALHWYLADNWFTINYGGIDLHGRWKALHYMSKRFFAPILVSGAVDTQKKKCEIFVNNDTRESRQYDLRWKVTSAAGQSLAEGAKPIRARPGAATRVETLKLKALIEAHGARDVLVWLELYDGDVRVSENFVHFERPKAMDLIDPCIEASVGKARNGEFHVTLKTKHPALWTWLELTDCDARFSENFVCLCPDAPVTIAASPEETLSLAQFKKQLQVRSLYDTFNCG